MKKYLKINSNLVSSVNDGLIASWNTEEIFPTPKSSEEPITDLTGCTWVANSTLSIPTESHTYNIAFTCDGETYTSIRLLQYTATATEIAYFKNELEYTTVYSDTWLGNKWADEKYKTLEITGGNDATSETLITYLNGNGTLTK